MLTEPPIVQYAQEESAIELAWGHPDPVLLPVSELAAAAAQVLGQYGPEALAYGNPAGPGPLLSWVADRLGEIDGRRPAYEELAITAGNSQGLDMVATLYAATGDVMLVESPTYHFAFRIFRDHGLLIEPVPMDGEGLLVEELPGIVQRLRSAGHTVRLLYTVPTFHNPTGITYSDVRRRLLVEVAADLGLVVIEDDPYRELAYDGTPPSSLWSIAPAGTVVRLGTFSKSLAPGLRVGFVTADDRTADRIGMCGLLDSGGAISHFTGLAVAVLGRSGAYASNLERLRGAYRARRAALLESLAEHLGDRATWTAPHGGYFLWLTLADGRRAEDLLRLAEARGTTFVPGPVFHADRTSGSASLRLAFSRHSPDELSEAVRRLGMAVRALP